MARSRETIPAVIPLVATIASGSLLDILRVRLLSSPHNAAAPNTPNAPIEIPRAPSVLSVSRIEAMAIRMTAPHASRFNASLNINTAISAVAIPSKLSSKEAVAAGVVCRLYIRIIGAATPPASTAPASQGRSVRATALLGAEVTGCSSGEERLQPG